MKQGLIASLCPVAPVTSSPGPLFSAVHDQRHLTGLAQIGYQVAQNG